MAVLAVLLLAVGAVAIYAAVRANQQPTYPQWHGGHDLECKCCYERARAISIWQGFNNGVNLVSTDPTLSGSIVAGYFSPYGIWSVASQVAPIVGPADIYNFYVAAAANANETNQTATDQQLNWDCLTRTLSVQSTWQATLTQPRAFTPGSTATLPAGTVYSQDQFIAVRFNCNLTKQNGLNSIVYYRAYYDSTQTVTTYADLISPVCPTRHTCSVMGAQ